jgi:hypothetical protein
MLTFAGEGYSPEFIAQFSAIVARIDICAPLLGSDGAHCTAPSIGRRDRDALRALAGADRPLMAQRPLVFDGATIAALRAQFAAGTIRAACSGCSWSALCTDVAAGGFAATRLAPP